MKPTWGCLKGISTIRPLRRYAASSEDNIDTDHEQVQLTHFIQARKNVDVTTTVYNNDFFRDWFKNERVRGISNQNVLTRPEDFPDEFAILRGELDSDPGDLELRHNRRNYYGRACKRCVGWSLQGQKTRHDLEFSLRYHEDQEDRFQENDLYQIVNGSMVLTRLGDPGSQTNRVSEAEALAFFVQDRISLGKWTLTPGVRFEDIDYARLDFSRSDPTRALGPTRIRENGVSVVAPGIGVDYKFSDENRLFMGSSPGILPTGGGQQRGH